ncbi:MAG: ATP-binding protein [Syntrophobacteraceae bacterium]
MQDDEAKTKEQLKIELLELRGRVAQLEKEKAAHKRAEELLQTHLHRFYSVLSNLHAGILLVTEERQVEFANKSFCDLFDLECSPEELRGLSPEEMIERIQSGYADPAGAVNRIQEILDLGLPRKCEEVALRGGRTCLRDFIPLVIEGKRYGRLWHHQDITERKRAEDALQVTSTELQLIFRNMINAFIVYESVFDENGKYVSFRFGRFNDAYARIAKLKYEEVRGKDVFEVWPATEKSWVEVYGVVAVSGIPHTFDMYHEPTKGWYHCNAYRPGDSPSQVHVIFEDITERRKQEEERRELEERLQRAEKMEALGTLAGGVAHDLNNVLGIVVGYAELLLDDSAESGSARAKAMEIMKGGQKAAAIVQDLLTLARRGVSSRKVLNLNNIVLECRNSPEFTQIFYYHPNVRVKTDLEANLLNISGSAVHLGKSLMNLVSNAAEAMPEGGVITLRTGNQYLDRPLSGYDEVREGDYVVLSVSDTGEGIPDGDLKRIFEPFYTKKVMGRSGTGLGLAVIWGTVKDHLGYINVESEKSKGTTFTLYFPVTREDMPQEQLAVSAAEYMGNGESVLIVDDVKEQRELAGTMLKKLNYTVVSVPSGEEAVEYLKQNAVDLVVLDMIMDPGMDGLDTYAKILEIHPQQRAIIVSGFSETERVRRAQALGAGGYVKKPYMLVKLGLAVRNELDQPT